MGLWNIMLLISVSAMGTLAAYLRSPRHKALMICFPFPFTFAMLSLGQDVNATHVLGLLMLFGFWFIVYWLKHGVRLSIVSSLMLGVIAYCALSMFLAKIIPRTEASFWLAEALVCLVALILQVVLPFRAEPGHSTRIPVWVKLPLLSAIVLGLIAIKSLLAGFMTVFPMVGVLIAYEARYSLWTACRQIPILMLSLAFMMAAIHLASPEIGIYAALILGWIVMILALMVLLRRHWAREQACISPAG